LFFLEPEMNATSLESDIDRITTAIRAYPKSQITGAVLGTLVRNAAPELDIRGVTGTPIGTGALAKFIEQFLSHVLRRVGYTGGLLAGGDPIYEVVNHAASQSQSTTSITPSEAPEESRQRPDNDYWNAFVRPLDPRTILIRKTPDGYELSLNPGTPPPDSQVVSKVTQEDFDAISEEYIKQLAAVESTASVASELSKAKAYPEFAQILRNSGATYSTSWSAHRRDRLRDVFVQRLIGLGLSKDEYSRVLTQLDRSESVARAETRQRVLARLPAGDADLTRNTPPQQQQAIARAALKAAIDQMSLDELRSLQIPFGHALDAVLQVRGDR
jgi:hypothetical protein